MPSTTPTPPSKTFTAPDLGAFDVLEQVIPEAKKRGRKTICWYEDVFRRNLPNIEKLQEVELSGNKAATLCFNNPDYLSWLQDIAEDWSRSYDIDGIMWGSARRGRSRTCWVRARSLTTINCRMFLRVLLRESASPGHQPGTCEARLPRS